MIKTQNKNSTHRQREDYGGVLLCRYLSQRLEVPVKPLSTCTLSKSNIAILWYSYKTIEHLHSQKSDVAILWYSASVGEQQGIQWWCRRPLSRPCSPFAPPRRQSPAMCQPQFCDIFYNFGNFSVFSWKYNLNFFLKIRLNLFMNQDILCHLPFAQASQEASCKHLFSFWSLFLPLLCSSFSCSDF